MQRSRLTTLKTLEQTGGCLLQAFSRVAACLQSKLWLDTFLFPTLYLILFLVPNRLLLSRCRASEPRHQPPWRRSKAVSKTTRKLSSSKSFFKHLVPYYLVTCTPRPAVFPVAIISACAKIVCKKHSHDFCKRAYATMRLVVPNPFLSFHLWAGRSTWLKTISEIPILAKRLCHIEFSKNCARAPLEYVSRPMITFVLIQQKQIWPK